MVTATGTHTCMALSVARRPLCVMGGGYVIHPWGPSLRQPVGMGAAPASPSLRRLGPLGLGQQKEVSTVRSES